MERTTFERLMTEQHAVGYTDILQGAIRRPLEWHRGSASHPDVPRELDYDAMASAEREDAEAFRLS